MSPATKDTGSAPHAVRGANNHAVGRKPQADVKECAEKYATPTISRGLVAFDPCVMMSARGRRESSVIDQIPNPSDQIPKCHVPN